MYLACGLAALTGCPGNGSSVADATVDADDPICGPEALFTGEYVDWDSKDTDFCGVFGAKFTMRSDATHTASTAPNGRFRLCLPHAAQTLVEIPPPMPASGCPHITGTYPTRGLAVADGAVIAAGAEHSLRAMTQTRFASAFAEIGEASDPAKAQLFVHVHGTPRAVTISSASHAPMRAFDGAGWSVGDTGIDVWVPNLVVGAGTVRVDLAGGGIGTGPVPLEAGTFTYVTVVPR